MPGKTPQEIVVAGGREVTVTNPAKVLFPDAGYTKLDLVRYYLAVADGALRAAGGRPNVLVRYPNGIKGEFFYQKRAPESRPPWTEIVSLRFPSGRSADELVPRDAATLAWMANMACLELHPHPVRAEDLDHPDELRIDLDPVPGVPWSQILEVAGVVHATLGDFGLIGWPKTSGSRGIHVYVRIAQQWPFTAVRRAALAFAREVERRAPSIATSKWWKEERHGVFLDYNQNAKDRTVAAAYSVRPTPDGRVSAPLTWQELAECDPHDFTLKTMPGRFAEVGDRHRDIDTKVCELDAAARVVRPSSEGRPGRRAVAAALPEAGRRAGAGPAVPAPHAEISADRDRARTEERGCAGRSRALACQAPGRGVAPATGRRPGRCDARPLPHLDADPHQPAARSRESAAAAGGARSRRNPYLVVR